MKPLFLSSAFTLSTLMTAQAIEGVPVSDTTILKKKTLKLKSLSSSFYPPIMSLIKSALAVFWSK